MNHVANSHSFSLEHMVIPGSKTKEVFGPKYAGNFTVRRPTLRDNSDISLNYAAAVSKAGASINPMQLTMVSAINLTYIFCYIGVVAKEKPEWFDDNALYEDDEPAVFAVFTEVERWLSSFRPQAACAGGQPGSDDDEVLVPAKI